jgi:hypothetical protein
MEKIDITQDILDSMPINGGFSDVELTQEQAAAKGIRVLPGRKCFVPVAHPRVATYIEPWMPLWIEDRRGDVWSVGLHNGTLYKSPTTPIYG